MLFHPEGPCLPERRFFHMSYNPHDYKHLFKKGLFDYPNKKLDDWNQSHRLFALNQEPQKFESKKLAPGLILKKGHLKIGRGFSNFIIFEIDTNLRRIETYYSAESVYPIEAFKKIGNAFVLLNLGYYYLTTHEALDPIKPPPIRTSNLAVFKGKLINLPIIDRSAFLVFKNRLFKLALVKAQGIVKLNGTQFSWAGSKTKHAGDVTVYNSSNIKITNVKDPIIGPYRTPNRTVLTPRRGKKFVVCKIRNGRVKVVGLKKSKFSVNEHQLVLELSEKIGVRKGDPVIFETVDIYKLRDLDFAVSIGPILKREPQQRIKQVRVEGMDNDPFLSNFPHREQLNLARGCLLSLGQGKLVTVSIDGIPQAGEIYPGVTPGQLAGFLNKTYPHQEIAVCNDPANTLRVVYRNGRKTHIFGNTHYLAYRRLRRGALKFWPNGLRGRKIHTMLVVK